MDLRLMQIALHHHLPHGPKDNPHQVDNRPILEHQNHDSNKRGSSIECLRAEGSQARGFRIQVNGDFSSGDCH